MLTLGRQIYGLPLSSCQVVPHERPHFCDSEYTFRLLCPVSRTTYEITGCACGHVEEPTRQVPTLYVIALQLLADLAFSLRLCLVATPVIARLRIELPKADITLL
jgi:hypothetical protein